MFKQLRIRFILLTMVSVLAVLLIIMSAINLLNYRDIVRESDQLLSVLAENRGRFPEFAGGQPADPGTGRMLLDDSSLRKSNEDDSDEPDEDDLYEPDDDDLPGKPFRRDDDFFRQKGLSAETPFESRYFCITVTTDGSISDTDMSHIAAVDTDEASDYAEEVLSKSRTRGFFGQYRYLRTAEADGSETIIFLDCTRTLRNVRTFFLTSILVSAVGFAAVMLLVILFSRRIVRPIQESYEKQKRFITDAGHELKTPLTVINADLSVLEMDTGESEWIDDARLQTERLTKLTNDLVYLSRMDEEQRRVEMIDFPLSDVITEVAQSFRSRAIVEEKRFESSIAPMLSFFGDEKAVRELVSILLDNALKYSPPGGSISISLTRQNKNIALTVSNHTAEAIDPEAIGHLFDRFYRTDQSRSSETGGFGLGLAIARAVVTAHRGKITASSDDGRSLTITALLPPTK